MDGIMKYCWVKELVILQSASAYLAELKHKDPLYSFHHRDCDRILDYVQTKIDNLVNNPESPSYCAGKECWGGIPFACDCGCPEGAKRCDGVNHR